MTYAYGPPPYAPVQPTNPLATSGFVVALVGAVLALIPFLGVVAWVISPVGLVLSIVGLVLASSRRGAGRGLGIAGTVLGGVGLVICVVWVAAFAAVSAPTPPTSAAEAVTAAPLATRSSSPTTTALPPDTFSDGTYEVGREIRPGRYRTTGADPDSLFQYCSAGRQKLDGSSIGFPESTNAGPAFVTIRPTDGQVQFVGDCTWTRVP